MSIVFEERAVAALVELGLLTARAQLDRGGANGGGGKLELHAFPRLFAGR